VKVIQRIALTAVVLLGILAMGVYAAPGFLLYTTPYEKSDAIVLLLGPDFSARHRHAQDLLQKGVSDFLIIPAYRKIYFMDEGVIKTLSSQIQKDKFPNSGSHVPPYFEDTHVELLEAKKTMDLHGKKTAIFVSSPYHMRRIQLIVRRVFGTEARHSFSPTPYEMVPHHIWQFKTADWKKVWREYLKISWFMIYSRWA
jgi:uncharacterized SAM-binding protein YcdF (DUF218 family)